jgi:O-antigen/teichoic acid export membrane protein
VERSQGHAPPTRLPKLSARRRSAGSQFVRNAVSSYGARALLAVSALVLTPYLYRRLGAAGFGTWSIVFTLTTVFNLVQLGVSVGPVKLISELRANDRRAEVQETVGASVALLALAGLLALAASAAAAFLLDGLAADGEQHAFRIGMIAVGAAMLIRFPAVAYMGALEGYQRWDLSNLAWSASTIAFAAGAVAAVESGAGTLGVIVASAASLALSGILFAVFLHRADPELSLRPRLSNRATRRRVLHFSSYALLADSMVFVGQRMDVVVIAAIRNATTAAPYAAAVKLQSGLQSLTLPFVEMLMPMLSELWAQGDRTEVARRFTLATRVAAQITLPVAVGLALFSHDIVHLWLGPEALSVTARIVTVLVAVQVFTLIAAPAEKLLVGVGRVKIAGALAAVEGVGNISVSALLVWKYGAIGAAVGTLLTSAVLAPVKLPIACGAIGFSTGAFLRDAIGKAAASSLPAVAGMAAVYVAVPEGPLRLLLAVAVGAVLAAAVASRQINRRRLRASFGNRGGPSGVDTPLEPAASAEIAQ